MTRAIPVRSLRAFAALLALLSVVAGCGGGGATDATTNFLFAAVGPDGAVLSAGPLTLTIPQGALTQPTGVSLLPQGTPLPLDPGPADPCLYSYVGPIYCCGPLGQPLLVNGALRFHYDEALIPPGFTEADLVLLVWDNANGVMRPAASPPVVQNTAENWLEDPAYSELGHAAVGLRDCSNAQALLLVQGGGQQPQKAGAGSTAGEVPSTLHLVDADEVLAPAVVPTGGLLFDGFVPSPSGQRVLLSTVDPMVGARSLHTVRVDGTGVPAQVAVDASLLGVLLQNYGNFYGWLGDALGDHVFFTRFIQPSMQVSPSGGAGPALPPTRYEVLRRVGTASAGETLLHVVDASVWSLDDVRQSADASHLMTCAAPFSKAPSIVDVVNVPSGAPASLGLVPRGGGDATPRFLTASDDLYVVDDGAQGVNRYTPEGAFGSMLFTISVPLASPVVALRDFALAPDDDAFAAVVDVDDGKALVSELWLGTLSGGVDASYSFFSQLFVNELIWHPQGNGVFLDASGFGVAYFELRDDDGLYVGSNFTPVFSLADLDVDRVSGRIAALVRGFRFIGGSDAQLPPGIYLAPPDASSFTLLAPAGIDDPRLVRWVRTWRRAVGQDTGRVR